jgi:hypothetical protein
MSTEKEASSQAITTTAATKAADNDDNYNDDDEELEDKQYTNRIKIIGEKGVYDFEFVEGPRAGERVKLPRQKISNRAMLELEEDRAEYAALISQYRYGRVTREERHQAAQMLTDIYAKLAKYYFHIQREEFDLMDWDSTKPNIDAAANVSVRGRPNVV